MYHPVTTWGAQVRQTLGASKTRTFVPVGARGVRLKSKASLRWASEDRQGLMQDGRSRFNVGVSCEMSLP